MRHPLISVLTVCVMSVATTSSFAEPATQALGHCFTDNTTGKERKELARWLFTAMAAHPELQALSNVTPADREAASRTTAAIFTRLLADACPKETQAAKAEGGSRAVQAGFGLLGEMAMQELMSDPQVAGTLSGLEKYVDRARLEPVLR